MGWHSMYLSLFIVLHKTKAFKTVAKFRLIENHVKMVDLEYVDGIVQDSNNSIANTLELLVLC